MSEAPKTVRVRIAMAITPTGQWCAFGYHGWDDAGSLDCLALDDLDAHEQIHWIEADVPIPQAVVVEGRVTAARTGLPAEMSDDE